MKNNIEYTGFIDGDFRSDIGNCKYYCYPTCHPAQVGPETVYGCTSKVWPQNRDGDFVPIVQCGGDKTKCEILEHPKLISLYRRGLEIRIKNAQKKIKIWQNKLNEMNITEVL